MKWRIFLVFGAAFVGATLDAQRGGTGARSEDLEFEVGRIVELRTGEGFTCQDQVLSGNADRLETRLVMDKMTAYYFAIVTGRGERSVHPAEITLINQNKKSIKLPFQNSTFGTEFSIQPFSNGEKQIIVRLTQKTSYRVLQCSMEAALYRTKQVVPKIEDHTHF